MLVECDCGTVKVVQARYLRHEKIASCGCLKASKTSDGISKSNHPLYHTWKSMHFKCTNRRHKGYEGCGALGIRVCERWHDFNAFIEDMGARPKNTMLTRIDLKKNFSKENCAWLTALQKRTLHTPKHNDDTAAC
jgi:hypothetical protein